MSNLAADCLALLAMLVLGAVLGAGGMHEYEAHTIAKMKANYNAAYNTAVNAKNKAEERADALEAAKITAVDTATTKYEKDQDAQHIQDQAVINGLRAGAQRLSVRTNHPATCGGALPGPAAGTAGSDGAATETLAGPVAARLAERYASYNDIVDELTLCQATVTADRLTDAQP